jgi:hypothetical protein
MRRKQSAACLILTGLLAAAIVPVTLGCGGTSTTVTLPSTSTTVAVAPGGPSGSSPVRFQVNLTGSEVVPPVDTSASGIFFLYVEAGPNGQYNISYELDVKDIVDVTAAHIHMAVKGAEGPVIVTLFNGPAKTGSFTGPLAQGSILETDFTGPMSGKTFADLTAAVLAGETYVNVHTKAYPNGELRGQIIVPTDGNTATGSGAEATTTSGIGASGY